jgi:hypothetical protein
VRKNRTFVNGFEFDLWFLRIAKCTSFECVEMEFSSGGVRVVYFCNDEEEREVLAPAQFELAF